MYPAGPDLRPASAAPPFRYLTPDELARTTGDVTTMTETVITVCQQGSESRNNGARMLTGLASRDDLTPALVRRLLDEDGVMRADHMTALMAFLNNPVVADDPALKADVSRWFHADAIPASLLGGLDRPDDYLPLILSRVERPVGLR